MKKGFHDKGQQGMTMVEIIVVVAILGVLVTLGMQRFEVYAIRARQGEAKTMLNYVFTLQQSYHQDRGIYFEPDAGGGYLSTENQSGAATCNIPNELGFSVENCQRVRYRYASCAPTGSTFTAYGLEILGADADGADRQVAPGCRPGGMLQICGLVESGFTQDVWQVNETNDLKVAPYIAMFNADSARYVGTAMCE